MSESSSAAGNYTVSIAPLSATTTPVTATITLTPPSGTWIGNEFSGYSFTQTTGQPLNIDPTNLLVQGGGIVLGNLPIPNQLNLTLLPSSNATLGTSNLTIGLTDANGVSLGTTTEEFVVKP